MTNEEMYPSGWQKCHRCGVKDRPDQVVKDGELYRHVDARAGKCAEWKATLAAATPTDLAKAAALRPGSRR